MDVRTVGDALLYLGALAGALLAIGAVVWAVAVRPLKSWLRDQIRPPLDRIEDEMGTNGGGSLRDAVDRIESAQNELATRFTDHLTIHPGPGPRDDRDGPSLG